MIKEIGAVRRLHEVAVKDEEDEFRGPSRKFFSDSDEYSRIQSLMKLMHDFNGTTTWREDAQHFLKGKLNLTELIQSLESLQDFAKYLGIFVGGSIAQVKKDAKDGGY